MMTEASEPRRPRSPIQIDLSALGPPQTARALFQTPLENRKIELILDRTPRNRPSLVRKKGCGVCFHESSGDRSLGKVKILKKTPR